MSWRERDPKKRKVKPVEQPLYDLDLESSDDSDFDPDNHKEGSDDSDSNEDGSAKDSDSDESDSDSDDDDDDLDEALPSQGPSSAADLQRQLESGQDVVDSEIAQKLKKKVAKRCWGCLGDRNDEFDELVECDECGLSVHERQGNLTCVKEAPRMSAQRRTPTSEAGSPSSQPCDSRPVSDQWVARHRSLAPTKLGQRGAETALLDNIRLLTPECYGMSDSESLASVDSRNPVLPWFCDGCRAGVKDPPCELCPNTGGLMKETDTGKWVHVVCALYVPGLFPPDPDSERLSLQKMPFSKWGAKACSLCEDEWLARTGVCIECDAGMCRTYFHVTCAQKAGLLHEPLLEETEQADRFYAHCKLHSEKAQIRRRRQNYLLLQDRLKERNLEVEAKDPSEVERIRRKFAKARRHYWEYKSNSVSMWVPTQKTARAIITSATACRRLWRKAELMGIDTRAMEVEEAQVAALKDIGRKWHIPAAFSVEFIGYYLDRTSRIDRIKKQLQEFSDQNSQLREEQKALGEKYDQMKEEKKREDDWNNQYRQTLETYHAVLLAAVPNKKLPSIDVLCKPPPSQAQYTQVEDQRSAPTAAALHFPPRRESLNHESSNHNSNAVASPVLLSKCGICRQGNDPHLLAHCDNCKYFYHLGCLSPPLTRMPKKTKLMGWQCSECDKESSGSDVPCLDPEAPRKLRQKSDLVSPKVTIKPVVDPDFNSSFGSVIDIDTEGMIVEDDADDDQPLIIEEIQHKSSKKRRREKHRRYSPDLVGSYGSDGASGEKKRKRKKKSSQNYEWPHESQLVQHVPKIKIKPIPNPETGMIGQASLQLFVASTEDDEPEVTPVPVVQPVELPHAQPPARSRPERQSVPPKRKTEEVMTECDVCRGPGSKENMVKCDECLKCFHFQCLDPPVRKSPKIRGYSWHCADCDPTENDSD